MSEINVKYSELVAPAIESITLTLTEAEARAVLRVLTGNGSHSESVIDARLASRYEGRTDGRPVNFGAYHVKSQLRRALRGRA